MKAGDDTRANDINYHLQQEPNKERCIIASNNEGRKVFLHSINRKSLVAFTPEGTHYEPKDYDRFTILKIIALNEISLLPNEETTTEYKRNWTPIETKVKTLIAFGEEEIERLESRTNKQIAEQQEQGWNVKDIKSTDHANGSILTTIIFERVRENNTEQ